jgi:xanthine dehydrogenase accessory factor
MDQWGDGWAVLERASELKRQGQAFALATVVWRQGPSSGKQGCRAIISESGEIHGWIGGACAEPVVTREARQVIAEGVPRLLLLGTSEQFGAAVPEGMAVVPIACQSDGALEVYIEPVLPTPHLVVVGRSPMAHTLAEMAEALGWRTDLQDSPEFTPEFTLVPVDGNSMVVIATQGHGDEEAVQAAVTAGPAYIGLVASRRRGESVLGYLGERGVTRDGLDRVRVPAGLDLGPTSHREMAVGILAELVQLRASGGLRPESAAVMASVPEPVEAIDPVCGMTVLVGPASPSHQLDDVTYYFCSAGCRRAFENDPAAYVKEDARC